MKRGLALAVLQMLLAVAVAGKYAVDRERLPRAWVRASSGYARGQYVTLTLEPKHVSAQNPAGVRLQAVIRDGELYVESAADGTLNLGSMQQQEGRFRLYPPVQLFVAGAGVPRGGELWVEVSVPPKGMPRPIRIASGRPGN